MRSEQECFGIWVYTFLLVLSFWVNNFFYLSNTSYHILTQKDTLLCLHKFQENIIQVRISINLHLSFSQAAHDSNHINSYTNFCCNIWILLFFFYEPSSSSESSELFVKYYGGGKGGIETRWVCETIFNNGSGAL